MRAQWTSHLDAKEGSITIKIDRREDISPQEGERKDGDGAFADPVNNKYPVDTPGHVRAAWNDIKQQTPTTWIVGLAPARETTG